MLRKNELLEIKEMLTETKREILKTLEERIKSNDISDQREIGDIFDDADLEQSREFNLLLSTRERQKLEQIESALSRMENGEYGYCEDCGGNIPVGRLKASPLQHCVLSASPKGRAWKVTTPLYVEEKDNPMPYRVEVGLKTGTFRCLGVKGQRNRSSTHSLP
jgi:DnaK suppressor protein